MYIFANATYPGVDVVPLGDAAGDHGDLPHHPVFALFLRVDRGLRVLGAASTLRRDAGLRGVIHTGKPTYLPSTGLLFLFRRVCCRSFAKKTILSAQNQKI